MMRGLLGGIGEPGPGILVIPGHLRLKKCHNKIKGLYLQIKLYDNYK